MKIKKRSNITGTDYLFLIVSGLMSFDPGWFTKFIFLFIVIKSLILFNYLKTTVKLVYNEGILDYSSKFVKKRLRKNQIHMINATKIKGNRCGNLIFNYDFFTVDEIYIANLLVNPGSQSLDNRTIAIGDVFDVETVFYDYLNQIYNLKKEEISGLKIVTKNVDLIFSDAGLLAKTKKTISYIPNVRKSYKFRENLFINNHKQNVPLWLRVASPIPPIFKIKLTDEEVKRIKEYLKWEEKIEIEN